jgi:hypothetical protein
LQSTNLHFEYQQPDEFRVDALLKELCSAIAISTVVDSEHFYTLALICPFFEGKRRSY